MAEGGESQPVMSSFGRMYLEKYGFEVGQGLGKKHQGITEAIKVGVSNFCLKLNDEEVDGCQLDVDHPFCKLMIKKIEDINDRFNIEFNNLYVDYKLKCEDMINKLRSEIVEVLTNPESNGLAEFSLIKFVKERSEAKEPCDVDVLHPVSHDSSVKESAVVQELSDQDNCHTVPEVNECAVVKDSTDLNLRTVPSIESTVEKTVVCIHDYNVNKITFHAIYSLFSLYGNVQCIKIIGDKAYVLMSCVGAADLIVKHLNYRNVGKQLLKLSVININSCDIYVRLREEEAGLGINYEREIHEEYVRKGLPDIYAPTHKLYVCNISTVVTKEKLKEHFNAKGFYPMYITLLMNEGQKKQYAYVSLETEDLAIEALVVLHYSLLCDSHLYIGFAPISNFKKR